ncbi:L-fucose/L-arabinose isomerase family protein [Roseobacter sp.]|uniref:L-fucose/L-arabinose isomerase family protein n=1 Tax=Roseobacter sp. TaxID=1907202 RepID=UPI00385ABCC4
MPLTIGLINASLPSYFPDKHGVFKACQTWLEELAATHGACVVVADLVPMNGAEARTAVADVQAKGADFLLLLHGGFTMGDVAREIARTPLPMGVWATPEPNLVDDIQLNNFVSLNMSMSIARGVRDLSGHPIQWYLGAPGEAALAERMGQTIRALTAKKDLNGAKIGVIGGLAMTFYNMEVATDKLMQHLGVWCEHIDIHHMTDLMAVQSEADVAAELVKMGEAAAVRGVSEAQMALTARAALALRAIAKNGGYDALTVSDWPALQENPGMHPGAAFSWLEENDGLPVASEGDILGAVTQLVAKSLSGRVGCLLDMTSPDFSCDQILMWHGGGGPLYMAKDNVAWINHPMIGRGTESGPIYGAIADFEFAHGDYTILRVSRDGTAHFAVEGTVATGPASGFTGCRGWVGGFSGIGGPCSAQDIVTSVMEHGLEHHFILLPGRHRAVFDEFAAWSGSKALQVIKAHDGLPSGGAV